MRDFLRAEASYLEAPEEVEPIVEDVEGKGYGCEEDDCDLPAVAELSWPMEDHDERSGFFCQIHLDKILDVPA